MCSYIADAVCVQLLCSAGADVDIVNNAKMRCVDCLLDSYDDTFNELIEHLIRRSKPTPDESCMIKCLRHTYDRYDKKCVLTGQSENAVLLHNVVQYIYI